MWWTTVGQALVTAKTQGKRLHDGEREWDPLELLESGNKLDTKAYVGLYGIYLLGDDERVVFPPRWVFEPES